jgi:hypothetical protein
MISAGTISRSRHKNQQRGYVANKGLFVISSVLHSRALPDVLSAVKEGHLLARESCLPRDLLSACRPEGDLHTYTTSP